MAAGSITFDLLCRTASFETDTKRAEKRLKELKKEAEALGTAMGFAASAGVAALTYGIKESVDAMDDMNDSAQKVGTTTEALSALQYAAKFAGDSAQYLEQGMVKLAKAAVEGNDAFDVIGVSTKDANGNIKDTSALFAEVSDRFAQYKDGAEKTALAVEIFGKSGAELIPLLNGGADGLAKMTEEAKSLGLVLDSETAVAAAALNDQFDKLTMTVTGTLRQGTSELIPTLSAIADYLLDASKNGGMASAMFSGLKTILQAVTVIGSDVAFTFKMIGGEIGVVAAQIAAAARGDFARAKFIGSDWTAEAKAARKELDAFQARVLGVQDAMSGAGRAGGASADDWSSKIAAPIVQGAEKVKRARASIDKDAQAALRAQKQLAEEGRRLTESLATPDEKRAATVSNVGRLADAGVISPETQRRALAEAESVYQEYVSKQRSLLTEGLLSEEQEIAASYERRKQMILSLTEATESEKARAIADLNEKAELEQSSRRLASYRDLMTEEQTLTIDYTARKRQIEDDESITSAQRFEYLTKLAEDYHAKMQALDEADAAKKAELQRQQLQMVSDGFSGAAELTKVFAGEQSKVYQAMFAMSKAYAIADITIKQSQAIAKAWGENNYWVAAGLTVGLAAQFAGLISSTNSASFGGTRADGGSVNEGRSYLVGERGPEMFTPSQSGSIIPNDALGGQQQAANIRIVNAYDSAHVADFMGSDAGERVIMNAVRRNGAAVRQLVRA